MAYKLKFNFTTDSSILSYLKDKEIKLKYKEYENLV